MNFIYVTVSRVTLRHFRMTKPREEKKGRVEREMSAKLHSMMDPVRRKRLRFCFLDVLVGDL